MVSRAGLSTSLRSRRFTGARKGDTRVSFSRAPFFGAHYFQAPSQVVYRLL